MSHDPSRKIPWRLLLFLALALVLGAVLLLGPRPFLGPVPELPPEWEAMNLEQLPTELERREAAIPGLREDAKKLVVWAHPDRPTLTRWVLVFFHGYAASRREFDPAPRLIAQRLGANLFYTRFAGHGFHGPDGHRGVTAQEWLKDCAEALAIARRLGQRVAILGSSTGASLALWAAVQPPWPVDALILVSPNFGPRDPRAGLLNWPWAHLLVRLVLGEYRTFPAHNSRHGEAWDLTHHSDSLLAMAAVVEAARTVDPAAVRIPVLLVYHPEDPAVDTQLALRLFQTWASPLKELRQSALSPPNNTHVLAGDLLSPDGTQPLVEWVVDFLQRVEMLSRPSP